MSIRNQIIKLNTYIINRDKIRIRTNKRITWNKWTNYRGKSQISIINRCNKFINKIILRKNWTFWENKNWIWGWNSSSKRHENLKRKTNRAKRNGNYSTLVENERNNHK